MAGSKHSKELANFVLKLREEKGLTQKGLAELIGVHPQYVSDIERTARAEKPVSFCARLMPHVSEKQVRILTDLIMEMTMERVASITGEKSGDKPKKPKKRKPYKT